MRRLTLLIFGICFTAIMSMAQDFPTVSYDEVESSRDYIKGNIYQKDLLLYSHTLLLTHPHFCDIKRVKELQKRTMKLYKECGTIEDVKSFRLLLQRLISPLDDGHTQVATGRSQTEIFPLYLMFDTKTSGYILAIDKLQRENLGKRVTAINNEPIEEFLVKAQLLVSGDNEIFKNIQISKNLSLRDFWREYGYEGNTLNLTFADGTEAAITATTADGSNLSASCKVTVVSSST